MDRLSAPGFFILDMHVRRKLASKTGNVSEHEWFIGGHDIGFVGTLTPCRRRSVLGGCGTWCRIHHGCKAHMILEVTDGTVHAPACHDRWRRRAPALSRCVIIRKEGLFTLAPVHIVPRTSVAFTRRGGALGLGTAQLAWHGRAAARRFALARLARPRASRSLDRVRGALGG